MIYVLIALAGEAPELRLDPARYRTVFTGVGKVNAALATAVAALRPDCTLIVNYGTAGVLRPELAGRLLRVGRVRQRDMDARPMAPLGVTPFEPEPLAGDIALAMPEGAGPGAVLSTGDDFVRQPPELTSDLVDMEGYAIVKTARHLDREVIVVKYGSDFADAEASAHWQQNQARGAALFGDWLAETFGA